MSKNTYNERLYEMMNLYFMNKNERKIYKFLSFKYESENYTIVTDRCWITKHESEMSLFFESHIEAEQDPNEKAIAIDKKSDAASAMFGTITGIMLENIQKVQEDSKYIAQAREVKASVDSIINATRLHLDIIKEDKKKILPPI